MTELSRQLAIIAANSTQQLNLKAQKAAHGKSLLFDSKDAVSQDFDGLYQLCREGFDELCALDNRFLAFSQTLFSEQSREEEREQWTQDQNQEFDGIVNSFLDLAGSKLLLKPAQKAVEWLVRRFRIQDYNTDAVLYAFVPYHSTPIFQSLLTILLPQKISPSFRFLQPYLTNYSNPPVSTIIHAATHNAGFFAGFNKTFLRACSARVQSSPQVSLWSSVMTQAVGGMLIAAQAGRTNVQESNLEKTLLRVIPVINDGLAVKGDPEVVIGCCMMITVLTAKGDLQLNVQDSLMEALASTWSDSTTDVRLSTIALLAQERQTTKLNKAVTKRLLLLDQVAERIFRVSQKLRADRLAMGLALGCIDRIEKRGNGVEVEVLTKLLRAGIIEEQQLPTVIRSLFGTINTAATVGWRRQADQVAVADIVTNLMHQPSTRKPCQRAMKKLSLTQDTLETALGTVLELGNGTEAISHPVVLIQHAKTRPNASLIQALEELSLAKASKDSFLTPMAGSDYQTLADTFEQALDDDTLMHQFLDLPTLMRSDKEASLRIYSFLARVAVSSRNPGARGRAIQLLCAEVGEHKDAISAASAMLPYFLCSLGDALPAVRRNGADSIRRLAKRVNAALQQSVGAHARKHAYDKIYGDIKATPHVLTAEDMNSLFRDLLLPSLEACALDQNVVSSLLEGSLRDDGRLPQSCKTAITNLIAFHATYSPLLQVSHKLSQFIPDAGKTSISARSAMLDTTFKQWISLPAGEARKRAREADVDVSNFDSSLLKLITAKDDKGLNILHDVLDGQIAAAREDIQKSVAHRVAQIWPDMSRDNKASFALQLLKITTDQHSAEEEGTSFSEMALDTLRSLKLDTDSLIALMATLKPTVASSGSDTHGLKRRKMGKDQAVTVDGGSTSNIAIVLRQYSVVLELLEGSQPAVRPELLQPLFRILGDIHQLRSKTESDLVYLQGLAIDCLLKIVDKAKDSGKTTVDKTVVRADLIVDCIRTTSSPQVQRAALLLISCLAVWMPDVVLHSVMPIFTFLGENILRQSDDYSAHVIDQTISRVVPPLVASLKKKSRSVISGTSEMLTSFTAAFDHVPQNRRLDLFEHITRTLGPEECLFAVLVMLVDRYPSDSRVTRFAVDLLSKFDSAVILTALNQYVELVVDLLKSRKNISQVVLHLKGKSEAEVNTTAMALLDVLAGMIEDRTLRERFTKSSMQDQKLTDMQRVGFGKLVASSTKLLEATKIREGMQVATSKVMTNILRLLPLAELIQSAENMLSESEDSVRLVFLRALGAQITDVKQIDTRARSTITALIPQVQTLLASSDNIPVTHASISLLDQIIEKVGKQEVDLVVSVLPILVGPKALASPEPRLKVIAALALATAVDVVKDDFISVFPAVMSQLGRTIKISIDEDKPVPQMFNAAFALVNAIVEHLPYIMGEQLAAMLKLSLEAASSNVATQTNEMRQQFYRLITTRTDLPSAFAALQAAFSKALNEGFGSMAELLKLLQAVIAKQTNSSIRNNVTSLFDLLLSCLDIRRAAVQDDHDTEYDNDEIEQLENLVIEIAGTATWALSDITFRPSFVRLVEWASTGKDRAAKNLRAVAFFRLIKALFIKLKTVLTSYTSYCIELTVSALQTEADDEQGRLLLRVALEALEQSLEHASEEYWQSLSNFTPILSPLLTLLSSPTLDASKSLTTQCITTIVAYASAATLPDHHKSINSYLLKFMRHEDTGVRLRAVQCQALLTDRLAEDWLALLSEMLPVITELLEDDDEKVERETRKWVKGVEGVLGESLDAMLQ